jgi:pyruvate/2-oxoglutarate dehydrogenase complex dihydrolipoamide acyltransferase (E2) component
MISPSAGFYMRSYFILPSEVNGSGPKHIILKEDVLKFIKDQNLKQGEPRPKQQPKSKPKEEKKPKKHESNDEVYDPMNIKKQSWKD